MKLHLFFLDSKLSLRLSEDGKIGNFTQGDLAVYLRNPLRILNESAESVLRQATVIIEALHERVIERGGGLLVESCKCS